MSANKRNRYERLTGRYIGIERVHKTACSYIDGKRCNCAPSFRAEAYDKVTKQRARKTLPTADHALRWRQDRINAHRTGKFEITDKRTFGEVWCEWFAAAQEGAVRRSGGARYKLSSLREYQRQMRLYVLPTFDSRLVEDVRRKHVQELIGVLVKRGLAPNTIRNAILPMRVVLDWAERQEYVHGNAALNVVLPSGEAARERVAPVAEALELLAALDSDEDRELWAAAFFTGMRRGELMGLRCEDVDLKNRQIRVWRAYDPGVSVEWTRKVRENPAAFPHVLGLRPDGCAGAYIQPKTKNAVRTLDIPKLLVPYLASALMRRGNTGLLFGHGDGNEVPFKYGRTLERAYRLWDAAGLERITLHECRHTYASYMIAAGIELAKISKWMGHATITITIDRYGHLLNDDREVDMAKVDAYLERASAR